MILRAIKSVLWGMDHMPLAELSSTDKAFLKQVALESIRAAVIEGRRCTVSCLESSLEKMPDSSRLSAQGACFVTLLKHGRLRGCIGTLEVYRSLLEDVVGNAYSAAMCDPRFPAVTVEELDQLELSISVLTEPEEVMVKSESDLIRGLVPHVDGLILQDGVHRATYLPSVWEQLPDRTEFVCELKGKAGLPSDYWSSTIRCFKYQVESIK